MHQHQHQKKLRKKMGKIEPSKGPTFYLFLGVLAIIAATTSAYIAGVLNAGFAWPILIVAYYFVAMCVHDAIHLSAHADSHLNRIVGWIGSLLMGMTFHAIRRSHMQHHASVGHAHDTEAFVYRSALTLPLRLAIANFYCYTSLRAGTTGQKIQGISVALGILGLICFHPGVALFAWIIPMQTAGALFALNTVYLPHGPLANWVDERAPELTGFHRHHHSMPQLPWYQLFHTARKMRKQETKRWTCLWQRGEQPNGRLAPAADDNPLKCVRQ